MRCLRTNRDGLLNVLESFVHDPLLEWSRPPKPAKRNGVQVPSEHTSPQTTMKKIGDRLEGVSGEVSGHNHAHF